MQRWHRASNVMKGVSLKCLQYCLIHENGPLKLERMREKRLDCHAHSCGLEQLLNWGWSDMSETHKDCGTHTSPEQVLFSWIQEEPGCRKLLGIQSIAEMWGGFACTRCHWNVHKTAVHIPHIWCFLQQSCPGSWILPLGSSMKVLMWEPQETEREFLCSVFTREGCVQGSLCSWSFLI